MQGVQPLLPHGPVPGQPFIDLGEWLGPETIDPPLRFLANLDEPSFPQHSQVSRYPGRAIGTSADSSPAATGPRNSVSSMVRRLPSANARRAASTE